MCSLRRARGREKVTPAACPEQVCDGAEPQEQAEWELLDAREFKYLNKSSTFTLPRVDNAEEYRVRLGICEIRCSQASKGSVVRH